MVSYKVLVVNKMLSPAGLKILQENADVTVLEYVDYEPESLPSIKAQIKGHDAIIWNTKHRLSADILDLAGPQLKAISTVSSGTDHIDVVEVRKRGICLGTAPVMTDAVADIAVGLLIAAARRFKEGHNEIMSGEWKYGVQWTLGLDIVGSTVGIIGLGAIGQTIVKRLRGFDVGRFIYCGRSDKPEATSLGVERVPLEQLFTDSDYIILSCPLNPETKHIINASSLKKMKTNAIIINIGRGGLIDQNALYIALKDKQIFAAGLDVTTPEPLPQDHPILALPNCFIIPHVGSATEQTRASMAIIAAQNVLLSLDGKPMRYPVF